MYHCTLWEEGQVPVGLKTPILLQPQLGVDNSCENTIECMNSGFRNPQVILMERGEKIDDNVAEDWPR